MASKDQAIGALIFIVCVVVAIGYIVVLAYPNAVSWIMPGLNPVDIRFWAVAIIVLIAFLAIMFIGAWIGYTMATTPPPKPIEELETETEEEKPKAEEKPAEESKTAEEKPSAEPSTETKTQKRKRKQ